MARNVICKWEEATLENVDNSITKTCIVCIPIYKDYDSLKEPEKKSLEQVVKVLGENYEICIVCPKIFDITKYKENLNYDFAVLKCANTFFSSQRGYSNLCETWQFYDALKEYEYMLIYQTDAWIFEDKVEYFCNLGYDYIGAPHMFSRGPIVGNGGLSLRKVNVFTDVCKKTDFSKLGTLLEDRIFTEKLKSNFNIAPVEIAFQFSFQDKPRESFKRNGNKLPMGCHGFEKNEWAFWKEYIPIEKASDTAYLSRVETSDIYRRIQRVRRNINNRRLRRVSPPR